MSNLDRAKQLMEVQLGDYLYTMDAEAAELTEEDRASYAGKVVGLSEAIDLLESAENGTSLDDLDVGGQTLAELRERAEEYRDGV